MRTFLLGLLLGCATALQAAEIRVLSSNALKAVLEELAPQFEKSSGNKVTLEFGPAADLKGRIDKGERFDMAVLTAALMDDLAKNSRIAAGSRFDLAKAGVGVAYRKGAARPDVSTTEAFRKSVLSARSVAFVGTGASGAIVRGVFERLGIGEEMKGKTKLLSGVGAAHAVAHGDAEIGFTQVSEILGVDGAELAGPLPAELQVYTVFPAAGAASAREPTAVLAFLRFLRTPEAAKVIRAKGMEPG